MGTYSCSVLLYTISHILSLPSTELLDGENRPASCKSDNSEQKYTPLV